MVTFRPATPDDFALHVRLMPELEVDDPPPVFELWCSTQMTQTLVAEVEGRAVGTVWWQLLEGSGYVRQIIVSPEARRSGAGRAMMLEVQRRLIEAKCTSWQLNVKPKNVAAVRLYESLGFVRVYGASSWWVTWEQFPPGEVDAVAEVIRAEDDERLGDAFGLPRGQLREARSAGRIPLRVDERAVAIFSPSFPGRFRFA